MCHDAAAISATSPWRHRVGASSRCSSARYRPCRRGTAACMGAGLLASGRSGCSEGGGNKGAVLWQSVGEVVRWRRWCEWRVGTASWCQGEWDGDSEVDGGGKGGGVDGAMGLEHSDNASRGCGAGVGLLPMRMRSVSPRRIKYRASSSWRRENPVSRMLGPATAPASAARK